MSILLNPGKYKCPLSAALVLFKTQECFYRILFIFLLFWSDVCLNVIRRFSRNQTWPVGGALVPDGGNWAKCFLIGLAVKSVRWAFSCVRACARVQNLECVSSTMKCPARLIKCPSFCHFCLCATTVDSEDGVAIEAPGTLNLDTEFLLGHDLEFDHNGKILNLDKFSGA